MRNGGDVTARVREALAQERMRIARELHDEFGAAHTAMRLELVAMLDMQPPCAPHIRRRLLRIEGLLARCAKARRDVVHALWPAPERQIDLAAAVQALCREVAATTTVTVRCETAITAPPDAMPAGHALAAFRIVQEALSNTLAHAKASQAEVTVSWRPRGLDVSIRDDGIGFDPGMVVGPGRGIAGMRARVTELDGRWSIASTPGCGTTVRIHLPVRARGPLGAR